MTYPRKNIIAFGMLCMGICFCAFSLLDSMNNPYVIIAYSLVLRLLQGASSATMQTTCYAIATDEFPDPKKTD